MPTLKPEAEAIPAAEANRRFSELLRGVREEGRRYIVTSHGRPVAKLTPLGDDDVSAREIEAAEREAGWAKLIERLRAQPLVKVGPFKRDDAYDD